MANFQKRDFQLGDFYLSQLGNSPAWCRTWFDADSRQTRRVSLGTTDFEEAKQALTDWFVLNQTKRNASTDEMPLAEVIARYWQHHGQNLPSAERTRLSLDYWLTFFGDACVADLGHIEEQERFHHWLMDKGMKATTVSRVLVAGRAAVNRAWKRGEIASAPFIHNVAQDERESAPPRGRPMEVEEIARLVEAAKQPRLRRFIVFMLATAGRPDAIRELTVDRCEIKARVIRLNPRMRAQTTKYRPTVRMPESIVPLVRSLRDTSGITHVVGGKRYVHSVRTAWRRARADAELDEQVNPYSLRHTMARRLRMEGVSAWEVSAQLGHKRSDLSITEIYAPYDPTYLKDAARAIDSFFAELRANCVLVDEMLEGLTP